MGQTCIAIMLGVEQTPNLRDALIDDAGEWRHVLPANHEPEQGEECSVFAFPVIEEGGDKSPDLLEVGALRLDAIPVRFEKQIAKARKRWDGFVARVAKWKPTPGPDVIAALNSPTLWLVSVERA